MKRASMALLVMAGCASGPEPVRPETFMRVGVDPVEEARGVERTLNEAGWETSQRIEGEGYVALGFVRAEQRAVRVITSRGVGAALDSHEPDGVRERHGRVSLVEGEPDVDGDGEPEVVVMREDDAGPCLAVLRIGDEGQVRLAPDDATALQEGGCVSELRDVDGDGVVEALVRLRWPDLALGDEVAEISAALVLEEGAWRARGMPTGFLEAEREARNAALARARAARDVDAAVRIAVELAALAHLEGATVAVQVERFDAALAGLVLSEEQAARVGEVREVVASGWGAR